MEAAPTTAQNVYPDKPHSLPRVPGNDRNFDFAPQLTPGRERDLLIPFPVPALNVILSRKSFCSALVEADNAHLDSHRTKFIRLRHGTFRSSERPIPLCN
jgi:hypothetical protein